MKRPFCIAVVLALLLMPAYSENEPDSNVGAGIYEQITMSMTLKEVTESFGKGVPVNEYLLFGDALCSFFESGRLQAKSKQYNDIREVAAATQGDFDKVKGFTQGTHENELAKLLGEGNEVLSMNLSDEDEAGLRKLIAWKNADGAVLEALFELDDGEWVLFALGEIA